MKYLRGHIRYPYQTSSVKHIQFVLVQGPSADIFGEMSQ